MPRQRLTAKERLVYYKLLLMFVKKYKIKRDLCFMCNIMHTPNFTDELKRKGHRKGINPNHPLTIYNFPELSIQSPHLPHQKADFAWYYGYEYDARIKHIKKAIKTLKEKYHI